MIDVIVSSIRSESIGVNSYELAKEDGSPLPSFSAGSHVDVHLPNGLVRQYSLCNNPAETHRYLIGVLNEPASRGGSKYLHENIKVGDSLKISEPRNLFPLTPTAKKTILFAGGIGITPILCMAERLAHTGANFEMHYCSRSADRTAFIDVIKSSAYSDHVHLHFDDGAPEQKLQTAAVLGEACHDKHLYVCGPGGFIEHVINTALNNNWQDDQIHREYFAATPQLEGGDQPFQVKIGSTGQTFDIPAEKNIIEVLADAGIDIPLSCEQGICGTCLTRVLDGVPDHRDMFLTAAEHAQNDVFTPCCSRSKSALLVLDI